MSTELKIAFVTCPNLEKGVEISEILVDQGLAACVNIIPAHVSIYRWEGKICKDPEVLLLIKFAERLQSALEQKILETHPYSTPEFVVVDTSYVNEKYLSWALSK